MFALRCLHPPGGASALLCALGGVGLQFVLFPVLVNCLLIVIAGMVYNTLTGRPYPHAAAREPGSTGAAQRFSKADLDAALTHYNEVLDINRDDLEALLHYAEAATYQRRFGDLRCKDIMSPDLLTAQFGTPLTDAWTLMRQRHVKALPVVDKRNHIIGIVTVADFMRHAGLEQPLGIMSRLKSLVAPSGTTHSEKPEVVGQIMTRAVRVSSADRHLAELVPLFSEGGHHHIPIIDGQQKAVGIITQTDLVKALYKAAGPTTAS
jgi:CBS domain-containing membrane protein